MNRAAAFIRHCDNRFRLQSQGILGDIVTADADADWSTDGDGATAASMQIDGELCALASWLLVETANLLGSCGVISVTPLSATTAGGAKSRSTVAGTDYEIKLNSTSAVILPTLMRHLRAAIGYGIPRADREEYVLGKATAELTSKPHFVPKWRIDFCWRDYKRQCMRR